MAVVPLQLLLLLLLQLPERQECGPEQERQPSRCTCGSASADEQGH
jgi:hypothetical protein